MARGEGDLRAGAGEMEERRTSKRANRQFLLLTGMGLETLQESGILSSPEERICMLLFSRNITSRILMVIDNTTRLAAGKALNSPTTGCDEIAELDRFLYRTGSLRTSKKELVEVVSHELKSPLTSLSVPDNFTIESVICPVVKEEQKFPHPAAFQALIPQNLHNSFRTSYRKKC
jgi:hypothetical protein